MDDVLLEAHEDPALVLRQIGQGKFTKECGKNADADHPVDGPQPVHFVRCRDLPPSHLVNNILSIRVINSINVKNDINRFSSDSINGINGIDWTQQVRTE